LFEGRDKVVFDVKNLSNISFMNTDLTGVRFSDNASWGENEIEKYKIIDERILENSIDHVFRWNNFPENKNDNYRLRNFLKYVLKESGIGGVEDINFARLNEKTITMFIEMKFEFTSFNVFIRLNREENKAILTSKYGSITYEFIVKGRLRLTVYPTAKSYPELSLGSIKAVYRNLRENYEYRMRYDEADQFFIREMELKRIYREAPSVSVFKLRIYKLLGWFALLHESDISQLSSENFNQ
jgi:hypothetical protein